MKTGPTRQDRPHPFDDHDQRTRQHQLDDLVPDPSGRRPLCDEPEFAAILEDMVADGAPRLFAVVQEYGERVDSRIAAWGMAFEDHAEVVPVEGGQWRLLSLRAPENALRRFTVGSHIRARLVWFNPDAISISGHLIAGEH